MKSPLHALAILIAAAFAWGVLYLFGVKFTEGDVYPEYSSLRSDPAGVKLLYDSLSRIPGLNVFRNYLPLDAFSGAGTTLVLLGMSPEALSQNGVALQKIAGAGNRIVAALAERPVAEDAGLEKSWQVRLEFDPNRRHTHRFWFTEAAGWRVLEQTGGKILTIEREFGNGTVVLLAEGDDFSNQSTIASDGLDHIIEVLGDRPYIVFDENHLGIAESATVVALARRFRLTGLALGLAIVLALWIWRASSPFPPPRPAGETRLEGRTSHSGLLTLLRRHVPERDLLQACWEQWHSANRHSISPEKLERAASLANQASGRPLDTAGAIHRIIHSKGPL
jgi:hypothetical protein